MKLLKKIGLPVRIGLAVLLAAAVVLLVRCSNDLDARYVADGGTGQDQYVSTSLLGRYEWYDYIRLYSDGRADCCFSNIVYHGRYEAKGNIVTVRYSVSGDRDDLTEQVTLEVQGRDLVRTDPLHRDRFYRR